MYIALFACHVQYCKDVIYYLVLHCAGVSTVARSSSNPRCPLCVKLAIIVPSSLSHGMSSLSLHSKCYHCHNM